MPSEPLRWAGKLNDERSERATVISPTSEEPDMRAIQYHQFGDYDVLVPATFREPVAPEG